MSDIYTTAPEPTASQSYEIGRAHGIKAEQECIIEVLEDADSVCSSWAVALIKGEK